MRDILIGLMVLLWLLLGWIYNREYKNCCQNDAAPVSSVVETIQKSGPLLFNYASATPVVGEGWPRIKDSLVNLVDETHKLDITGWYCTNTAPPEDETLGLSRARETRKLFADLNDDQIIFSAKGVDCAEAFKSQLFESASFGIRTSTASIKETANATDIYFPFNSTNKLNNKEVEAYLDDVAQRVIASGETIQLNGHTDNIGSPESNMKLGQRRADIVKNYLLSKGVNPSKIESTSEGETQPVQTNETEKGRAANRRTELKIIQ